MKSKTKCWWLSYEGRPFWSTSQWIVKDDGVQMFAHMHIRGGRWNVLVWRSTGFSVAPVGSFRDGLLRDILRCGGRFLSGWWWRRGTRGSIAVILVKTKKVHFRRLEVVVYTFCYRKFLPLLHDVTWLQIFLGVRTHCRSPNPMRNNPVLQEVTPEIRASKRFNSKSMSSPVLMRLSRVCRLSASNIVPEREMMPAPLSRAEQSFSSSLSHFSQA